MTVQTNKTRAIQDFSPHYSNPLFRHPQTVFLAPGYQTVKQYGTPMVKEATYQYSDRLWQWDWEKSRQAWDAAKESGATLCSAGFIETYLRLYFNEPTLNVVHIAAGVNHSNGYPYQVFGYILEKAQVVADEKAT